MEEKKEEVAEKKEEQEIKQFEPLPSLSDRPSLRKPFLSKAGLHSGRLQMLGTLALSFWSLTFYVLSDPWGPSG